MFYIYDLHNIFKEKNLASRELKKVLYQVLDVSSLILLILSKQYSPTKVATFLNT